MDKTLGGENFSHNKNEIRLYHHPFSPSYWIEAARECRNLRVLAVTALLIALQIAMKVFFIPLPVIDRRIYFTFLPTAVASMICGPLAAIGAGFISDIIGFMVAPAGSFYFGYTLSSIAGSLIYALFLYRARPSIIRLALAKASVNLFVNTIMGAVWLTLLTKEGYIYYITTGGLKNLILLPFEIIVLAIFIHTLLPVTSRLGLTAAGNLRLTWRYTAVAAAAMVVFAAGIAFYLWSILIPPAGTAASAAILTALTRIR